MSDAPDIRRPAARTRTAAYFILFSPRYVSFRDLLMAPRRVPVYTSPLPLTPFFGKPFVEIGAVRTRRTVDSRHFAVSHLARSEPLPISPDNACSLRSWPQGQHK